MSRRVLITVEDTLPNGEYMAASESTFNCLDYQQQTELLAACLVALNAKLDNRLWIEGGGNSRAYPPGPGAMDSFRRERLPIYDDKTGTACKLCQQTTSSFNSI